METGQETGDVLVVFWSWNVPSLGSGSASSPENAPLPGQEARWEKRKGQLSIGMKEMQNCETSDFSKT